MQANVWANYWTKLMAYVTKGNTTSPPKFRQTKSQAAHVTVMTKDEQLGDEKVMFCDLVPIYMTSDVRSSVACHQILNQSLQMMIQEVSIMQDHKIQMGLTTTNSSRNLQKECCTISDTMTAVM